MGRRLDQMTTAEIQALDRERAVIFLIVSGLEDHGPHLPMNADLLEATALAERVAAMVSGDSEGRTVLFYPPATLAWDLTTSRFAVSVRGHVLRDYLIDTCTQLIRMGFKNFVCFTGSYAPANLTAIEEAGAWLRRKHRSFLRRTSGPTLASAGSVAIDPQAKSESSLWMNPPEHGGARDTSILLAIDPSVVRASASALPTFFRGESGPARWLAKRRGKIESYWGSPADARAELGKALLNERAKEIFPKLKAVWGGADPRNTFKSWYSLYPTNRTLFPIWVLFVGLVILGALWLGALLQAVTENLTK